jgi:hypothetical protein
VTPRCAEFARGCHPRRTSSCIDRTDRLHEKAEQIVDSYLRAGEQGDWRALDALVNRVYGRPTERIEQVTGESEIKSALKQLSKEDLQAMVQQGRQGQEVKAIMRVMTAEERDELLGRMTPEERREILEERELAEQREREWREEMRLRGDDPDDPRPKETGTPEDFAWKDRGKHGCAQCRPRPSGSRPPKKTRVHGLEGCAASPPGRRRGHTAQ